MEWGSAGGRDLRGTTSLSDYELCSVSTYKCEKTDTIMDNNKTNDDKSLYGNRIQMVSSSMRDTFREPGSVSDAWAGQSESRYGVQYVVEVS